MQISNIFVSSIGITLVCLIVSTHGYRATTAREMITQNLCVCPCGNPRGGKLYTTPNLRLNWFDAVSYCSSIGMSIATIKDANERQLLQLHLDGDRRLTRSQKRSKIPYWIGANSLIAGQRLRWGLTDQEVKESAEWADGVAPANNRVVPFCVYIQGSTMSWVATSCDDEPRQFICEY
uniref:CTL4 n=1 Tax=Anopheles arabiensis TaxID=7173 RepID=A5A1M9_ANOAR|nr:CTL4 [Anopheles arabiensis]